MKRNKVKMPETFADVMELMTEIAVLSDFANTLTEIGKKNIERLEKYIFIFDNIKPDSFENVKILHVTIKESLSFVGEGMSFSKSREIHKGYQIELSNLERIANNIPVAKILYKQLIAELYPILKNELARRKDRQK